MLKILIAEDDYASGEILKEYLSSYGNCEIVVDGFAAIVAMILSIHEKKPFDLVCLDIMMPKVDGVKVLKAIRDFETKKGILPENRTKVIMTTALSEAKFVQTAFEYGCEAYISKPIEFEKIKQTLSDIGLSPD